MSFVCARMSPVCHSCVTSMCLHVTHVLICHLYATRMYSYAICIIKTHEKTATTKFFNSKSKKQHTFRHILFGGAMAL